MGTYDRTKLPSLADKLDANAKADLQTVPADSNDLIYLSFNPFELPTSLIQAIISDSPAAVDEVVREERRKSFEVLIPILRVVVPAGLVFGVVKKIGEKTVDLATEEIFAWLKATVTTAVGKWSWENNRAVMLVLETEINVCIVEFVTSLNDDLALVSTFMKAPLALFSRRLRSA